MLGSLSQKLHLAPAEDALSEAHVLVHLVIDRQIRLVAFVGKCGSVDSIEENVLLFCIGDSGLYLDSGR